MFVYFVYVYIHENLNVIMLGAGPHELRCSGFVCTALKVSRGS